MNYMISRFTSLILILVIIMSGCGVKNEMTQSKTPNTPINTETSPSPQPEDGQGIFSDVVDFGIDNPKTYFNEVYNFSVDYPASWDVFAVDPYAETDLPNGSPDNGINIYVESDKDDRIYVYGQNSHIALPRPGLGEEFLTSEGVSGYIMEDNRSEGVMTIYLALGERFVGAVLHIDENAFEQNKRQILGILKSIKINLE